MRNFRIAIVVLVLIAFTSPLVQADENHELWSPSTYVQSAKIHYKHVYVSGGKRREDLYHCINLLKEAANRFGRVPEFYYMLGTFYAEINAIDTVVMYFDSVQAMCDDTTINKKYRKNCYKKDNYIKKMRNLRQSYWEKSYNSAVEFLKQYDAVTDMIAQAPNEDSIKVLKELQKRAFDAAWDEFKSADMAKPNDLLTLDGMAVLLQRENRHKEAIDYYMKALKIERDEGKPDSALVSKIAYAYIYIPDWEKSVEWFEKVVKQSPTDINALINLSIAYNNIGDREKWYEYTTKVLELQPDNTQFLFNAGQYWFVKMQDAAAAMADIKDDDPDAETKRADLEKQAKERMEKAAGFFERIVEIDPKDTDALRQLGILNLLGQNPEGAISALSKYVEVNPNDNDVLDFLGRAYIMSGDSKAAIKPYEMITENDPGNIDAWERLGDLYEYNKMMDKAKAARAKVKELKEL